jgi:serine/threonine-protein kinase RsbT
MRMSAIRTPLIRMYIGGEVDVRDAMRQIRHLGEDVGFSPVDVSYLATAASELASNLFIHAGGGTLEAYVNPDDSGVELVSIDSGPGIPDVSLAMQDGFSTSGGLGCGLPGVKRLMDGIEIDTQIGTGTRIRAWKEK